MSTSDETQNDQEKTDQEGNTSTEQPAADGQDDTPPRVTEPQKQDESQDVGNASASKQAQDKRQDVGIEYEKDVNNMKARLDAQPRVRFYCPLNPGEPKGTTEMVQINGFKMTIRKGEFVSVPEQVANILAEHYGMESPLEAYSLEKQDEEAQNALR